MNEDHLPSTGGHEGRGLIISETEVSAVMVSWSQSRI